MKPKSIIHVAHSEPIRSPTPILQILKRMDGLDQGGTMMIERLTDHGTVKKCFFPNLTVTRIEEA